MATEHKLTTDLHRMCDRGIAAKLTVSMAQKLKLPLKPNKAFKHVSFSPWWLAAGRAGANPN